MSIHADSSILDRVGTTTEIATLMEVSPQAVSQWRRQGIQRPRRRLLGLLRPEAFVGVDMVPTPQPEEARDAA